VPVTSNRDCFAPVSLAQSTGIDLRQRCGDRRGNREVRGVDEVPLLIQAASPPHRGTMLGLVSLDLPAAAHRPVPSSTAPQRMAALVRVRADHDHMHRPLVG
jgi:hypothetical protein